MLSLNHLLKISVSRHSHFYPRQAPGARIDLGGAKAVGLEPPVLHKRLLVILVSDGCFADGLQAATGCSVGHRTLRIEDYGKIAATFVDGKQGKGVLMAALLDAQERAAAYAPGETAVARNRPGVHVNCELCGEEIINGREVKQAGMPLCQACAKGADYQTAPIELPLALFNPHPVMDQ